MKKKLILLGGGGHAESVIDTIRSKKEYQIEGILDNGKSRGMTVSGIMVLGSDELLADIYGRGIRYAVIAIGSVGNPQTRIRLFEECKAIGYQLPCIIDKSAVLPTDLHMGEGIFIGKGAVIGAGVSLGNGCIINSGSILEHGCTVGSFAHTAPGCTLCGNVKIGDNTHIGAGSTVIQNLTIGSNSMIGAGSLVLSDISSNKLVYGSPTREVGRFE
ncbi:sugar O-acyltransferase (sialic acid O-acetyltransferase NeuD family) [Lacrimispora xylanisolvens]|uniref:Sugar O-acyltransferase (Sialic acid O-acetyltransferase NeuD family) n=1 Tax=Lacrimispora xylanisolvens TaxID=384636 RepID=A0A2S6HU67_9FIRM|nr:acetyltransferase [Hungatella xylanolytica]PPK81304.1 sugar O-acyltransferase (sialic acid O-acetyltransferase NeuD family) [Hungatella xylanolytica]